MSDDKKSMFSRLFGGAGAGRPGEDFAAAAGYAAEHGGLGLYAVRGDQPVYQHFAAGRDADTPHALASGSKSLCGLMAICAIADGLLQLDERIADTLTEWQPDARKSRITVCDLLGMHSGLRFVPPPGVSFDAALAVAAEHEPDSQFHYNGANFQVFGALMRRKLGGAAAEPLAYLQRRVLDPIGFTGLDWRTAGDDPFLPGGGIASARAFATLGSLLLAGGRWNGRELFPQQLLADFIRPSAHNPRYGLTFWLLDGDGALQGAYMAAGLGGQRLYVLPQLNLAIVRQARLFGAFGRGAGMQDMIGGHGYEDREFLALLTGGR